MFAQLLSLVALSVLFTPVPTLAVPGAAWIRRQEDAQSSLTLDPAVISHGLEQDGQGDNPDPGQVRSLTSSNNFINFCLPFLDQGVVLTNGAQVTAGSCNQVPMGRIISLDLAPRCKFVFPKNGDESIVENQPFTVQMKILNMETGNFVNAQTNYYAAPQQVNGQGIVIGHSHIVIEAIPDLQTTEPLDPNSFAFFKGLNDPVDGNNILSTAVTAGLPAGIYRMCSINTAANHQPALVSNAQHGALDDCSYFTVKAAGANNTDTATATDSAAAVAATDSATQTNAATDTVADAAASTTAVSATDAAQTTDAAATDAPAATDAATDVPAATDSATDAGNEANASTDAPAATATDSAAPAATPDNGNNGNGGDNNNNNNGGNNDNGNNGGNNDNGNNGGNNDNSGNNNGGDNSNNNGGDNANNNGGDNANNNGGDNANNNGGDSSAAPAATESTAPAADDNAGATPSQGAPADSPSAAPEATPTPDSGNNNGNNDNGGANDNQGGNDGGDNATASTA